MEVKEFGELLDETTEVWKGSTTVFYNVARLKHRRKISNQEAYRWDKKTGLNWLLKFLLEI